MKKFMILLFLSVSVGCLANDLVVPKGAPCPDGGYHPIEEVFNLCCKNGFHFEVHSKKYDGIQAYACGCPYGGTPSETCKAECCKDGYAFGENSPPMSYGSGKYDVLRPGCCCPYGGTRSETGACCKDKYAFNEETNKYDLIDGSCGCPNGGTPIKFRDHITCCNNGFEEGNYGYSHKENYKLVQPEICGCPENGRPVQTGYNNSMKSAHYECCNPSKPGYRWSGESYSDYTPEYCGCPDGGELKPGRQKNEFGWKEFPYCCKNNYLYDKYKNTYSKVDIRCGCPKGHEKECEKQKEILENPEKALEELKEFMTRMQDKGKMKKTADLLNEAAEKVKARERSK